MDPQTTTTSSPTSVQDDCQLFASVNRCLPDQLVCNDTASISFIYTCTCSDNTECHRFRGDSQRFSQDCPCPAAPFDFRVFLPIFLGVVITLVVIIGTISQVISKRKRPQNANTATTSTNDQVVISLHSVSASHESSTRSPPRTRVYPSPAIAETVTLMPAAFDMEANPTVLLENFERVNEQTTPADLARMMLNARLISQDVHDAMIERQISLRTLMEMDDNALEELGITGSLERARVKMFVQQRHANRDGHAAV